MKHAVEAAQVRFAQLLEEGSSPAQAAAAIVAELPLDEGHAVALVLIGLDYVTGWLSDPAGSEAGSVSSWADFCRRYSQPLHETSGRTDR